MRSGPSWQALLSSTSGTMRRHPALSGTPLNQPGCPSALGACCGWCRSGCLCWVFTAGGRPTRLPWHDISLSKAHLFGFPRSTGRRKRRLRGVGISHLPISCKPALRTHGCAGMAGAGAVSIFQRTNHLARNTHRPALVHPRGGLVGGHGLAIAPLGVYYGRSFQAEALLVFCAAGALEAHSIWVERRKAWALGLSWICFTGAALIKVIPLLWLGLPLLLVQLTPSPRGSGIYSANPSKALTLASASLVLDLCSNGCSGYFSVVRACLSARRGQRIDVWVLGEDSDRSNIGLALTLSSWVNLAIRTGLRALVVVGVPFIMIGTIQSWRFGGGRVALGGLIGMLICTVATMRSSTVHEYYQFPLLC